MTDQTTRRGGGTGAGRQARPVTKRSFYVDDETWDLAGVVANEQSAACGYEVTRSDVLNRALTLGLRTIGNTSTTEGTS